MFHLLIKLSIWFDNFSNLVISATKSLVGRVHGKYWLMFDFLLQICATNVIHILTPIQLCIPAPLICESAEYFI